MLFDDFPVFTHFLLLSTNQLCIGYCPAFEAGTYDKEVSDKAYIDKLKLICMALGILAYLLVGWLAQRGG